MWLARPSFNRRWTHSLVDRESPTIFTTTLVTPQAERVIVLMGSGAETVQETVECTGETAEKKSAY